MFVAIIAMQLTEPISRKLIRLGKLYQSLLAKKTRHLDVDRYHYVLSLIYHHDGQLSQKALAEILDKDKSAMVSIINLLTAKGFVYRENNPNDRREQLLKVTEKAKLAVPHIVASFKSINADITRGISNDDMKIFERVLLQMQNNIKPLTTT
jgi:MarR family transcriptional regulator for hemolysin